MSQYFSCLFCMRGKCGELILVLLYSVEFFLFVVHKSIRLFLRHSISLCHLSLYFNALLDMVLTPICYTCLVHFVGNRLTFVIL